MGRYYWCLRCREDFWLVGGKVSGKNEAVVKMREGKRVDPGEELVEFIRKHVDCTVGGARALKSIATVGDE